MFNPPRLVILLSGNGLNCQAIIDAVRTGQIPAQITAVISDQPAAYGLQRAIQNNIPTQILSAKNFINREVYDTALSELVTSYQPDCVVLAGFMRVLGPVFVNPLLGRLINIHPSLLPLYRGLHTHERALAAGDSIHGCTVHFVDNTLDGGPIIAQACLSINKDDSPETLKTRVQALEHQLYPAVIATLLDHYATGSVTPFCP